MDLVFSGYRTYRNHIHRSDSSLQEMAWETHSLVQEAKKRPTSSAVVSGLGGDC